MLVGGVYPSARGLCFLQISLCLSGPPTARKPKEAGTSVAPAALGYMTHTGIKDLHGAFGVHGGRCPQIGVPDVQPLGSRVLQCNVHGTPAQRLCGPAGRVDDRQGQPLRSQGLRSAHATAVNRRSAQLGNVSRRGPPQELCKSRFHDCTRHRNIGRWAVGAQPQYTRTCKLTLTLTVNSFPVFGTEPYISARSGVLNACNISFPVCCPEPYISASSSLLTYAARIEKQERHPHARVHAQTHAHTN